MTHLDLLTLPPQLLEMARVFRLMMMVDTDPDLTKNTLAHMDMFDSIGIFAGNPRVRPAMHMAIARKNRAFTDAFFTKYPGAWDYFRVGLDEPVYDTSIENVRMQFKQYPSVTPIKWFYVDGPSRTEESFKRQRHSWIVNHELYEFWAKYVAVKRILPQGDTKTLIERLVDFMQQGDKVRDMLENYTVNPDSVNALYTAKFQVLELLIDAIFRGLFGLDHLPLCQYEVEQRRMAATPLLKTGRIERFKLVAIGEVYRLKFKVVDESGWVHHKRLKKIAVGDRSPIRDWPPERKD